MVTKLRADGFNIRTLDLGGGLGVPYVHDDNAIVPTPKAYGDMVRRTVGHLGCKLAFEPGRIIAGNAGILVTRVIYVKDTEDQRFIIVDAGMNDLVRPAMYDANHDVLTVTEPRLKDVLQPVEIVGPVCETADRFTKESYLPPIKPGDLLAILTAGAYGAVMSSSYNTRPLVPEVMVRSEEFFAIRRRPHFEEMIALEGLPPWLK